MWQYRTELEWDYFPLNDFLFRKRVGYLDHVRSRIASGPRFRVDVTSTLSHSVEQRLYFVLFHSFFQRTQAAIGRLAPSGFVALGKLVQYRLQAVKLDDVSPYVVIIKTTLVAIGLFAHKSVYALELSQHCLAVVAKLVLKH